MTLYRTTTVGEALTEALKEQEDKNELTSAQSNFILKAFDEGIKECLSKQSLSKFQMRGTAEHYRHCDNTWTFMLNKCDVTIGGTTLTSKRCKIVVHESNNVVEDKKQKPKAPGGDKKRPAPDGKAKAKPKKKKVEAKKEEKRPFTGVKREPSDFSLP